MEHRFESHGLIFIIDGDGFMDARDDFDAIAAQTEAALDALPSSEVQRLHSGCLAATDSREAVELDAIASRIQAEVTKDWHDPNGAMVGLVAASK